MPPRTVSNPPNPWQSTHVELLEPAPDAKVEVFEEPAREILSENNSPDIPFRYSLNPYRGCHHGCAYCYARPTHQYLGFGAGTDFDRKIIVKTNAPERLRARFMKRSWTGDTVMFSGNTDCYQPLEASYQLTRQCLQVCAEFRNPVSIVTKGALIQRDIDVLQELNERARVSVYVSIAFSDEAMARAIEPWASTPARRLQTIRALADAGIPVGVSVSPVIPGLNEDQISQVLEQAADAGATGAFMILLRLAPEVHTVFRERLQATYPNRVEKVFNAITDMRGNNLTGTGRNNRMIGDGPRWQAIRDLYQLQVRKLGFRHNRETEWIAEDKETTFQRPGDQLSMNLE